MKAKLLALIGAFLLAAFARASTNNFPGGVWIPAYPTLGTTYGADTLDAAGEGSGCAFTVPKTGNISKVGFRTGTVTTPQTLAVSLQTTTSTGTPTGTMYGGSTAGTQASPASNSGYTVTLGSPAAAVKGDHIASVVMFNSTVGNLQISKSQNSVAPGGPNYNVQSSGSGWLKQTSFGCIAWFEYDDGSYALVPGVFASSNIATTNYNSSSSPDEYALKFQLPFQFSISAVAVGIGTLASDTQVQILNSNGTSVLEDILLSTNTSLAAASAWTVLPVSSTMTAVTLASGTNYYVTVRPNTTTNFGGLTLATYPSNAAMDQDYGGKNFYSTSRTNAGSWTDSTGVRPWISILITSIPRGGVKSTFVFD